MAIAYLGLGSNLGDQREYLGQAIQAIKNCGAIEAVASFYKTEPVGLLNQPWFVNCALRLNTKLSALELLDKTQAIENSLGRVRSVHWGPRTIDIDILLYGDLVLATERLALPHPRLAERRFVLIPLVEIAPNIVHPIFHLTVSQLLAATPDRSTVEKLESTNSQSV